MAVRARKDEDGTITLKKYSNSIEKKRIYMYETALATLGAKLEIPVSDDHLQPEVFSKQIFIENLLNILLGLIGHTQEEILEKLQMFESIGVNARQIFNNAKGQSVLHLLCQVMQETKWSGMHANVLISSLIKFGVDVNARDFQRTPLFDAMFSESLTRELIRHGADVNAVMQSGYTPIFIAADQHVLDLLIQHGANPNHKNDEGLTPLRFGLRMFNLENDIFQGLIKAGATIDEKTRNDVVRKVGPDRAGDVPEVDADAASWIDFFAIEAIRFHMA